MKKVPTAPVNPVARPATSIAAFRESFTSTVIKLEKTSKAAIPTQPSQNIRSRGVLIDCRSIKLTRDPAALSPNNVMATHGANPPGSRPAQSNSINRVP